MNRIQRIAAAAAISAAVLAPATIAPAFAEPYPGHKSDSASGATKTKAQIEYEERLRLDQGRPRPDNEGPRHRLPVGNRRAGGARSRCPGSRWRGGGPPRPRTAPA